MNTPLINFTCTSCFELSKSTIQWFWILKTLWHAGHRNLRLCDGIRQRHKSPVSSPIYTTCCKRKYTRRIPINTCISIDMQISTIVFLQMEFNFYNLKDFTVQTYKRVYIRCMLTASTMLSTHQVCVIIFCNSWWHHSIYWLTINHVHISLPCM